MTIRGHNSFIQTALAAGRCLHTRAAAIATSHWRSPGEIPEQRVEQELPGMMGTWPLFQTGKGVNVSISPFSEYCENTSSLTLWWQGHQQVCVSARPWRRLGRRSPDCRARLAVEWRLPLGVRELGAGAARQRGGVGGRGLLGDQLQEEGKMERLAAEWTQSLDPSCQWFRLSTRN